MLYSTYGVILSLTFWRTFVKRPTQPRQLHCRMAIKHVNLGHFSYERGRESLVNFQRLTVHLLAYYDYKQPYTEALSNDFFFTYRFEYIKKSKNTLI